MAENPTSKLMMNIGNVDLKITNFRAFAILLWLSSLQIGFTAAPTMPEILESQDGEQCIVFCPHVAWTSPVAELNCEIELSRDAFFKEIVDKDVIPALTGWYVCAERLALGSYFWRIRFQDATGQVGAWTESRRLEVVEPKRTFRVSPQMSEQERENMFGRNIKDILK